MLQRLARRSGRRSSCGGRALAASAAVAALLAAPTGAQLPTGAGSISGELVHDPAPELRVEVTGADGPAFLWSVTAGDPASATLGAWLPVGVAVLEQGEGRAVLPLGSASGDDLPALHVRALYLEGGQPVQTPPAEVSVGDEQPLGDPLDFDWGLGGVALDSGAIVSDVQPWADVVNVSAVNADATHPSKAILFDSSSPTGVDADLKTPGVGSGNHLPLGLLLVVAANDVDADGDGLVDVPDAEDAGGTLVLDFAGPATVSFLRLVDADEGATVRWFRNGELVAVESVPVSGDNSVYVTGGAFGITRVEVELFGSAGIGGMDVYPCEAVIDFDTTTMGVPAGLAAGTPMTEGAGASGALLGGLGLFLLADNADPGHPDEVVLFDTAAPTGGDDDLATPGPGAGNDAPLGRALVLAEDVTDANGDGLVDDPDDEAAGGVVTLGWYTSSGTFRGATVVDVDAAEASWIEVVLDDGSGTVVIPLEAKGDNSVQTLTADVGPTREVRFHLGGSAAIAEIRICPVD